MKRFLCGNLRFVLAFSVLLFLAGVMLGTEEIVAMILPVASEELTLVSCDMEQTLYDYTGYEITPSIKALHFENKKEKEVVRTADQIRIQKYLKNTEIGAADIEVSLDGYQGTLIIRNAFYIRPAAAANLVVTKSNQQSIDLSWDAATGADGYKVYKSTDNGSAYLPIATVEDGTVTTFQDTDIVCNTTFSYYICAYRKNQEQPVFGMPSNNVAQLTALETPKLTAVSNKTYNTNEVTWNVVPGAVGYQVYRSKAKSGPYECLAEISEGATATYKDATCECGKTYYYYVIACQQINDDKIYGDSSEILSAQAKPNRVGLSGKTTSDGKKVSLSWKQSTGAQGYELYRSVDGTSKFKLLTTIEKKDTLNWSESGLDKYTTYYYRIRPYCMVDGAKLFGSYSGTYEKEAIIEYNYSSETGVDILRQYVGRPYVYGGTSPTKGWDCSYFVKWTYAQHFGVSLPRTSAEQSSCGKKVNVSNRSEWKPGDLIFYRSNNGKGPVSHVAVYLGNGQMIHALNSRYKTFVQDVDVYEKWDQNKLYCVRRVM